MKKSIITTVIIMLLSIVGANAQTTMDTFEIQVDGLGCPFCAYGLEKKFKEFKGIKDVKIEIETGNFSFAYPADKSLTLAAVEKQVEMAGYTPMSTKIIRSNGKIETSGGGAQATVSDNLKLKTAFTFIYGNCGMCEARINKAAKEVTGVASAAWDQETKLLKVEFDPSKTSIDKIEAAVAKAGHDSKKLKAEDETYNNLPGCCKYERSAQ